MSSLATRLLLVALLLLLLLGDHVFANFTVFNTTLSTVVYPSFMFSHSYTHFPEWEFEGMLIPITLLPGCVMEPIANRHRSHHLVGIVTMTTANHAGCGHVYEICKAMQAVEELQFTGLLVNVGIGLETNDWFIARKPFQDVSDLIFPSAVINGTTYGIIQPFIGENGKGDIWVHVNDVDAHGLVEAFESFEFQADRFSLIALWILGALLILLQILVQNFKRQRFNTSTKVLSLCFYTCIASIIHMVIDPWDLDVDRSLFGLPLFISAIGATYLAYVVTVFKWIKLFNVFGRHSWLFKIRKAVIGTVMAFIFIVVLGTFLAVYFGEEPIIEAMLALFIVSCPLQIIAFAVYGYKVTRSLAKSAETTGSLEMRLAQIRMFSLTVVAIFVWFFAFIVSLVVAVTGDSHEAHHIEVVETVVNVFLLVAILAVGATYAFAYFTRHLLGNSSFDSGSHPSSSTNTRKVSDQRHSSNLSKNNTTTTGGNDYEMKDVASPTPSLPTIQEYQIGDLAVSF